MRTSSPKLDLLAATAATGAKVLSWAVAAAVVYRQLGEAAFAVLAMTRATLGLLNYTTFGLGPALTRMVAEAELGGDLSASRGLTARGPDESDARELADRRAVSPRLAEEAPPQGASVEVLSYANPRTIGDAGAGHLPRHRRGSPASLLRTTRALVQTLAVVAMVGVIAYSLHYSTIHFVPPNADEPDSITLCAFWLGLGMIFRLMADTVGGASQAMGYLAEDQGFAAAGDVAWIVLLILFSLGGEPMPLGIVAFWFCIGGVVAYAGRSRLSRQCVDYVRRWNLGPLQLNDWARGRPPFDVAAARQLLGYGGLVTLGSAADFLYAPVDYFILNRLVDPLAPAVYAPAVQIDAAVLVLVSAVATVALPGAARLAAAGDLRGVRRGYLRGSLLAGAAALAIAIPAWLLSPYVFELWLGNDLPATRAILPLILCHTVLGSAAGVGRATLVALGKAKAYAVVVLLGGLLNVALSLWFVRLGWGIQGVVLGTVASVAARCLIALPLLVWSATRDGKAD